MTTRFSLADISIDLVKKSVHRDGDRIHVTELSFAVLAALVEGAPKPVSAQSLSVNVWHNQHVSDETIAQRIKLLRRALEDNPKAPRYIRTVRGSGYACAAPLRPLGEHDNALWVRHWKKFALTAVALLAVVSVFVFSDTRTSQDAIRDMQSDSKPPSVVTSLIERAQAQLQTQQAENTERAIELLQRAYALDPSSAKVQVALSFALSTRATKFRARHGDGTVAEKMARLALQENPRMGSAWHALAYTLDAHGRMDEALSSYRHAFELDPTDVAAMSSAAYLLSIRGRLHESLILEARALAGEHYSRYAEIQIALVLDLIDHPAADAWRSRAELLNPNQVVVLAEAVDSLLRHGKPDAALDGLLRASESSAASPRLLRLKGRAALAQGDLKSARTDLIAAGTRATSDLAALDALSGSVASAEQQLKTAETDMINGDSWPGLRVQVAELHAALGNNEAALSLLSQAVDLGWRDTGTIEHSPFLTKTVTLDAWIAIRSRIERELAIQRTLIEASPGLIQILEFELETIRRTSGEYEP